MNTLFGESIRNTWTQHYPFHSFNDKWASEYIGLYQIFYNDELWYTGAAGFHKNARSLLRRIRDYVLWAKSNAKQKCYDNVIPMTNLVLYCHENGLDFETELKKCTVRFYLMAKQREWTEEISEDIRKKEEHFQYKDTGRRAAGHGTCDGERAAGILRDQYMKSHVNVNSFMDN